MKSHGLEPQNRVRCHIDWSATPLYTFRNNNVTYAGWVAKQVP